MSFSRVSENSCLPAFILFQHVPACSCNPRLYPASFLIIPCLFLSGSRGFTPRLDISPSFLKRIISQKVCCVVKLRNLEMLLSPNPLCLPQRGGVEASDMTLFRKPADGEDGRLISPNNHPVKVWVPDSFID